MLGGRRRSHGSPGRNKETGCKHAMMKEGTTAQQGVDFFKVWFYLKSQLGRSLSYWPSIYNEHQLLMSGIWDLEGWKEKYPTGCILPGLCPSESFWQKHQPLWLLAVGPSMDSMNKENQLKKLRIRGHYKIYIIFYFNKNKKSSSWHMASELTP